MRDFITRLVLEQMERTRHEIAQGVLEAITPTAQAAALVILGVVVFGLFGYLGKRK